MKPNSIVSITKTPSFTNNTYYPQNDEIEFAKLEEAYQAFVTEWVDENIHGKKPEEKEKKKR